MELTSCCEMRVLKYFRSEYGDCNCVDVFWIKMKEQSSLVLSPVTGCWFSKALLDWALVQSQGSAWVGVKAKECCQKILWQPGDSGCAQFKMGWICVNESVNLKYFCYAAWLMSSLTHRHQTRDNGEHWTFAIIFEKKNGEQNWGNSVLPSVFSERNVGGNAHFSRRTKEQRW